MGEADDLQIQKLTQEGYTLDEAKMIRDISHGLKPRASVRKVYENMSETEKLEWLTNLKLKAEGQYYGTEAGNIDPREQKVVDWASKELKKLPIYKEKQNESGFRETKLGIGFGVAPEVPEGPRMPPTAPRPELVEIWPKLSDEIKSKVSKALMAGATVDEIKAALKLEGLE